MNKSPDQWFWHYDKRGTYSIKSGYRLAEVVAPDSIESSNTSSSSSWWKLLWNLKIPPKVRTFIWRSCNNLLLTALNLFTRKVSPAKSYRICGNQIKDRAHALIWCKNAKQIWSSSPFQNLLSKFKYVSSLIDIMTAASTALDPQNLQIFCCMLWIVWGSRNKLIHGEKTIIQENNYQWAKEFLEEFKMSTAATSKPQQQCLSQQCPMWLLPPKGKLKMNTDTAYKKDSLLVGLGMAIRDENGLIIKALSSPCYGPSSAEQTEAQAMRRGLLWAREQQIKVDIIEMDALSVCNRINSNVNSLDDLGVIINDIKEL